MIKVRISKGIPYVWDANDWLKLRREHRIIGAFDGAEGNGWTSQIHLHLPFRLSTVEMQYLIDQGIAETVHAPSLEDPQVSIDQDEMSEILQRRRDEQLEKYKTKKLGDIELLVDKITEGKRKKPRGGGGVPLDRETIRQNLLNNLKVKDPCSDMVHVDAKDIWVKDEDYIPFNFPLPSTPMEKLRFRLFEDFHLKRKYFMTSGAKFGGDFLAYPGDPDNYHAEFIIMCQDNDRKYTKSHITLLCRLGQMVKKTILVAYIEDKTDKLKYLLPRQTWICPDDDQNTETNCTSSIVNDVS